jgi:predicted metal-binding membrane protein
VFVLGYLAVWTGIGLLPLMVFLGVRNIETPPSWLPVLSGAILIVAGLYQFTPWKGRCLRACQTPLGFIVTHDFGGGSRSAFSAGIAHGAFCLGCCWGLMAVLVVLGLMNLVWMAAIAVVFLAEKNWRRGLALARVAGAIVTALGIAVVLHPEWLSVISGGSPSPGMGGHM